MRTQLSRLDLLCGTDDLRPTMKHVLLTKEYAVATNAHVLAWIKTELEFDENFIESIPEEGLLIASHDWATIRQHDFVTFEKGFIVANHKGKEKIIRPFTQEQVGMYPKWQNVIPEGSYEPMEQVAFDLKLADMLRRALGFDRYRFSFYGGTKAIRVHAIDPDGRTDDGLVEGVNAMLMPCKTK